MWHLMSFSTLAFIQGIGGPELLIILVIILLLFGAKRLPELSRSLGKSLSEFKKGRQEGMKDEEPEDVQKIAASEPEPPQEADKSE